MTLLLPILAAALAALLTPLVRRHALKRAIDHPNHRSLHTSPTPRGGGIVIVAIVFAYVIYALLHGTIGRNLGVALLGGGVLIAGIGSLDDVVSLSASARLPVHFIAAIWAVWWLGGLPFLDVGADDVHLGLLGGVFAVFLVVWATNLYNFMDGIDGLAGVEAVCIAGAGGFFLSVRGAPGVAELAFVVVGAAVGFLCWNWQPARIFMGDAGSGFLGYMFAVLAVWSENARTVPLLVWGILAAAFVVDASITVARRARGGVWKHAHRSHAYQRAVLSGMSHASVVLCVGALNIALAALAAIALFNEHLLLGAVAAAVALTAVLYALVGRRQPFVLERPTHYQHSANR